MLLLGGIEENDTQHGDSFGTNCTISSDELRADDISIYRNLSVYVKVYSM